MKTDAQIFDTWEQAKFNNTLKQSDFKDLMDDFTRLVQARWNHKWVGYTLHAH